MKKQYVESEYSKKLRDPRWQKKRLEIMERDEFTCQVCYDSESTLNVHHCFYKKGNEPWEYPNSSLITLCETCHQFETQELHLAKESLINAMGEKGFLSINISHLADGISKSEIRTDNSYFAESFCWAMKDREMHDFIIMEFMKIHDCYRKSIYDNGNIGK